MVENTSDEVGLTLAASGLGKPAAVRLEGRPAAGPKPDCPVSWRRSGLPPRVGWEHRGKQQNSTSVERRL
jgi:hypothetical protein